MGRPLTDPGRGPDAPKAAGTNLVLLARPHQLVAPAVERWLAALGFASFRFGDLADLSRTRAGGACGAVVSTSVTSAVHAGVAHVLRAVRAVHDAIPVALVTIAGVRVIEGSLSTVLRTGDGSPLVRWIAELFPGSPGIGTPRLLPLIHRDDLLDPERAAAAGRVVCRHFGRP